MAQAITRFDDMLFAICKETGGIEGLLNTIFSFLFRRTDFFYESDPGDKMGFPPSVNQKILLNVYQQYQNEQYKKFPKKSPEEYKKKLDELKKKEEEKKEQQKKKEEEQKRQREEQQKQKLEAEQISLKTETKQNDSSSQNQQLKDQLKEIEKQAQLDLENQKIEEEKLLQETQKNQTIQQNQKKVEVDTYNGGQTEKYSWGQGLNEVTVQIQLPPGTQSKNVEVLHPNNNWMTVIINKNKYLDGELHFPIKIEDCLWNIEDGQLLTITLEKQQENIWKTVYKGDPEIDATKVDNSKPLHTFDDETQGAIRKIMYDQQRKQMGLPTSDEEKQHEALKKAWNAENSPFKGQPFDPTKFNLGGFNPPM